MTSSATYAFAPSNGQLILGAFERIQVYATSLRQEHMASAIRELNLLFAEASNRQVNLWKVARAQQTLTASTASYTLTARTVMVLDASIVLNYGDEDESRRYIPQMSRTEYQSIANQETEGPPTSFWLNRQIIPTVTFWPVPDDGGPYTFDYFYVTQMEDANLAGGETPDVPYRWLDWLVAGLSHRMARIYAPQFEQLRKADAAEAWTFAATQDVENVDFKISLGLARYYP
jgi:hypothetical protein